MFSCELSCPHQRHKHLMYTVLIYSIEVIECSGPACSSFACALNPCHGSVPKAKPHLRPSPSPSSFNSVSRKRPSLNVRIPIRSALVVIGNYSKHLQNRIAVRYCSSDSLDHHEQAV